MPTNHLIFCLPLLLLLSIFPNIKVFSNELALGNRWPNHWSFSFSISPSNEYSGLISFMIDWFDLLSIQGTLKSILQHHSWKHQFFGTQPSLWSNFYICTWLLDKTVFKIIWLLNWTSLEHLGSCSCVLSSGEATVTHMHHTLTAPAGLN